VRDFQRGGLSFALGLDGMAFDDDEDMLRELRLTTRLHGPRAIGQPGLSRAAALSACLTAGRRTIDGAKGYGALTPGADGDVVLLDSRGFSGDALEALVDPLALLNARATRHDVREVYCAGRCIVRAGRLQGLDLPAAEEALLAEARSAVASLGERAPLVERHQATVRRYYGQGHHVDAARRACHADQHADQSADQQKGS
jgi:cytosine/adenosine deaminase-related metal-dependent hydrolase